MVMRTRLPESAMRMPHASPLKPRSEEHTSELQSPCNLVCRLLLEKKKTDVLLTAFVDHRLVGRRLRGPEVPPSSQLTRPDEDLQPADVYACSTLERQSVLCPTRHT